LFHNKVLNFIYYSIKNDGDHAVSLTCCQINARLQTKRLE